MSLPSLPKPTHVGASESHKHPVVRWSSSLTTPLQALHRTWMIMTGSLGMLCALLRAQGSTHLSVDHSLISTSHAHDLTLGSDRGVGCIPRLGSSLCIHS